MGPWTIHKGPLKVGDKKHFTTLSFFDKNEKKIVKIVMDKANAYMLGHDLVEIQGHRKEAKKENFTVSLCQ